MKLALMLLFLNVASSFFVGFVTLDDQPMRRDTAVVEMAELRSSVNRLIRRARHFRQKIDAEPEYDDWDREACFLQGALAEIRDRIHSVEIRRREKIAPKPTPDVSVFCWAL